MTFDKKRVCVAGLHDIPVGTNGYCANTIAQLENYVTTENKQNAGMVLGTQEGYCTVRGKDIIFYGLMFYPLPKNQYRPYKTIEEALTLKGKWLKHKSWDCFFEVTKIEMLNGSAIINNIEPSFLYEMYTMEDGTPVGVPE